MKKTNLKLILIVVLVATAMLLLAACKTTKYTVTFDLNGGTGDISSQSVKDGKTATPPSGEPSKAKYSFIGWYTSNTVFDNSTKFNFNTPIVSNLTLYAGWEYIPGIYTVKFETNGAGTIAEQVIDEGNLVTQPANPARPYMNFLGWFTSNTDYTEANKYNFDSPVMSSFTLYAGWSEVIPAGSFMIEYYSNGGEGQMQPEIYAYGTNVTLTKSTFTMPCPLYDEDPVLNKWARQAFSVWNTEPDGSGVTYQDEDIVNIKAVDGKVIKLYVMWSTPGLYYEKMTTGDFMQVKNIFPVPTDGTFYLTNNNVPEHVYIARYWDYTYTVEEITTTVFLPVTQVGAAFQNFSNLKYVTIPHSVNSIGSSAFATCANLQEIILHEGITSLGMTAFSGCHSISELILPDSLTTIGMMAIYGMNSLKSITIPAATTSVNSANFYYCSSLTEINVHPDNSLFSSLDGVLFSKDFKTLVMFPNGAGGDYTVPDGVTAIGGNAFNQSKLLKNITFPSSVASFGSMIFGNASAATNGACTIESLVVFGTVPPTAVSGFLDGLPSGAKIYVPFGTVEAYKTATNWTAYAAKIVEMPSITVNYDPNGGEGVMSSSHLLKLSKNTFTNAGVGFSIWNTAPDGSGTFYNDGDTLPDNIPDGIITLYAMWSNPGLNYTLNSDNASYSVDGRQNRPTGVLYLASTWNGLPVTEIAANGFQSTSITKVVIPNTYKVIGENSFGHCQLLSAVILFDGITTIKSGVFFICRSLTEFYFPSSLKEVAGDAFAECEAMVNFYVNEGSMFFKSVDGVVYSFNGKEILFYPSSRTGTFTIPEGVTAIGSSLFRFSNLSEIILPQGLLTIGDRAFYQAMNISEVILPGTVTDMGEFAFYGSGINKIHIPGSLKAIGFGTFLYCFDLETVTIDYGIEYIYEKAFSQSSIGEIIIPGSVKMIYDAAFEDCMFLYKLVIEDGVEIIDFRAFGYCDILTDVTLPASLYEIRTHAFVGCIALSEFKLSGESTFFATVDGVLYSKDLSIVVMCPFGTNLTEITFASTVKEIGGYAFYGVISLVTVRFPASLERIGVAAFYTCSNLSVVQFAAGLEVIEEYAFYTCQRLQMINLPVGPLEIYAYAFYGATFMSGELILPEGLISIGDFGFYSINRTVSVHFPSTIRAIGEAAFATSQQLSTITIHADNSHFKIDGNIMYSKDGKRVIFCPDQYAGVCYIPEGVEIIEACAFYECNAISLLFFPTTLKFIGRYAFWNLSCEALEIPGSVETIDESAFYGNVWLTNLIINEGVKIIEPSAFMNCIRLPSVTIPSTVTAMGTTLFYQCVSLIDITVNPVVPPLLGTGIFSGCSSLTYIYVPAQSVEAYKAADGWREYADIICAIPA